MKIIHEDSLGRRSLANIKQLAHDIAQYDKGLHRKAGVVFKTRNKQLVKLSLRKWRRLYVINRNGIASKLELDYEELVLRYAALPNKDLTGLQGWTDLWLADR